MHGHVGVDETVSSAIDVPRSRRELGNKRLGNRLDGPRGMAVPSALSALPSHAESTGQGIGEQRFM